MRPFFLFFVCSCFAPSCVLRLYLCDMKVVCPWFCCVCAPCFSYRKACIEADDDAGHALALERLSRCCVLQQRLKQAAKFISSAAGVWARLHRREDKIRCLRVLKDVKRSANVAVVLPLVVDWATCWRVTVSQHISLHDTDPIVMAATQASSR